MTYRQHHGTVTGDQSQQVDAMCKMDRSYGYDERIWMPIVCPLDAPNWIANGEMYEVDGTTFQGQSLRYYR